MPRFVPRERKHKRQRQEAAQDGVHDSNQVQILPQSQAGRDKRRQKLKDELRAGQSQVSGKKAKRLEKYIETKLKKDENLELLKKLEKSRFDTSGLQSSRHLGKRKHGDFVAGQLQKQDTTTVVQVGELDLAESGVESDDSFEQDHPEAFGFNNGAMAAFGASTIEAAGGIGTGLKQPLALGPDGLPALQVKARRAGKEDKPPAELPWEGFSGSEGDNEEEHNIKTDDDEEDDSISNTSERSSYASEESATDGESDTTDINDDGRLKPRTSAFKTWAMQQINRSLDYTPQSTAEGVSTRLKSASKSDATPLQSSSVGNNEALKVKDASPESRPNDVRKAFSVKVNRSETVEEARLQLPIVAEEQKIMEAIHNNPVTIVWGATGSGKTTQVPQFLFEAGYGDPTGPTPGMIGVTQPRRVAAVSMARRVGAEIDQHSDKVSYQIRFDSTASSRTAIKFMTDGILLREIAQDLTLSKYSVIVIDEAHERSVNTDILIGMTSRIVDLRSKLHSEDPTIKPLKMVIMSATLRISDFLQNVQLFRSGTPPLVQAEGRQYPVTIHFSRQTQRDYVEEAFRKVSRGHRKLPRGGILVFLTGQNEIRTLLQRLSSALAGSSTNRTSSKVQFAASEVPLEAEDLELGNVGVGGIDGVHENDGSDVELQTYDGDEEDDPGEFDIQEDGLPNVTATYSGIHLLPLYSQLPTKEQLRIFDPPPENTRLIVLATNVAETSLTIPGIRYVFDSGRSKERVYHQSTGIQSFEIDWISKASAEQRAGRAGRTEPGHCYRLYSSAVYERDFAQHAEPEILRTPMESVVLQMKSMGIDRVEQFPFPTPPDRTALLKAEKLLKNLGAISAAGQVTEIGKSLEQFPLSPRYSKMLAIGSQYECMPYVIALVAGLSIGDLFIPENQIDMTPLGRQEDQVYSHADQEQDTMREQRKKRYIDSRAVFSKFDRTSDALKILAAVCGYAYEDDDWADEMFLRPKAMKEVAQLRRQLTEIVRGNDPTKIDAYEARLPEAKPKQLSALKQILTAGFIDQVAIRADASPTSPDIPRKPKRAIDVPYLPLFPLHNGRTLEEAAVYIHPSSVLSRTSPDKLPKYLVYSHLQQSATSYVGQTEKIPKIRMFPLTATGDLQLAALAHNTPLLVYGKPIGQISSLGGFPEKRECWVVPSLVGEAGSQGWPLRARKVLQRKDVKTGWIIEKFLS